MGCVYADATRQSRHSRRRVSHSFLVTCGLLTRLHRSRQTTMVLLPSQLRLAAKCLMAQRRYPLNHIRHRDRDHHYQRSFSQTSRREATEDPDSIIAQLQSSPIMRKIADKPEALKALNDFAVIYQDCGESHRAPERQTTTYENE